MVNTRTIQRKYPQANKDPPGFSQAFYREKLYESVLGFKDLEDFMKNFWEAWALSKGMIAKYRHPH